MKKIYTKLIGMSRKLACCVLCIFPVILVTLKISESLAAVDTVMNSIVDFQFKENVSLSITENDMEWITHRIYLNSSSSCNENMNILVQFVNAKNNRQIQINYLYFMVSLITQTHCPIHLFITCTAEDQIISEAIFTSIQAHIDWVAMPKSRTYLSIVEMSKTLIRVIKPMLELFSSPALSYYKQNLFFVSVAYHRVLPDNISRLIMFDIDMQLRRDVRDLHAIFRLMNDSQILALAREQQPLYWHVTTEYREKNIGTNVGGAPPHGLTGFNSGTKLMNLEAMRRSALYNEYLDNPVKLVKLANKYQFRGHLGDQDFYTLLSFDHSELFYTLPCQWNRQLCEWWREHGYKDIFDQYFSCSPPYFVLHGNCGTAIG